jgi:hypothetical protein
MSTMDDYQREVTAAMATGRPVPMPGWRALPLRPAKPRPGEASERSVATRIGVCELDMCDTLAEFTSLDCYSDAPIPSGGRHRG